MAWERRTQALKLAQMSAKVVLAPVILMAKVPMLAMVALTGRLAISTEAPQEYSESDPARTALYHLACATLCISP